MNYDDTYITNRALELCGEYSENEIARIISDEVGQVVSRDVVHGRLYRRKEQSGLEEKPRPVLPYFNKYREYYLKEKLPEKKVVLDHSRGLIKILALNDLHTPFQHEAALEKALVENSTADIVVTSEISDMYAETSFAKEMHVSFEDEVEEIIRWYEYLSENFPVTYVVRSGHDRRLTKAITSRIPTTYLWMIDTDLLELLATPFSNIILSDKQWYLINDALFTHLDKHSNAIDMSSSVKVNRWIQNWKMLLGIPEYKVLVQAHGHHSGLINYPDLQLVETGCLQQIPQWVLAKLPMLAWTWGWATVLQRNGVTDRNATRVITYTETN